MGFLIFLYRLTGGDDHAIKAGKHVLNAFVTVLTVTGA